MHKRLKSEHGVVMLPNPLPREKWADRISAAWQKQVVDIFEVGVLLEAAKAELAHGEWMKMTKEELPFGHSTANKLMKVGECDHLRDSEHVPNLPAHWGTLFELTLLSPEQFEAGIKSGAIHPKMQRKDVKALRGADDEVVKPKPSKEKDFDVICGDFALDIDRTARALSKEQRHEFLVLVRSIVEGLLQKESSHG